MNARIKRLRDQSLKAKPALTLERAKLMTEFYKNQTCYSVSAPVRRALAFQYLLANKAICINKGELIVGERGPVPKATPTFPEITAHSLKDLKILDTRKKIPFAVGEKTKEFYKKNIIPFWKDRSLRDLLFREVSVECGDADVSQL